MRDIRFRAFNGVEMVGACCVVDGSYFQLQDGRTAGNFMQFTGLHDKNGKEIYEGDVVKVVYGIPGGISILEVVWKTDKNPACDEMCSYGFNNAITGWWYKDHSHGHDGPMFVAGEDFEVIGNIHSNPELLK